MVSFSGDKLLGGPQAGFLVGRSIFIERMRTHPFYRALRADKLRLAAIEATLEAYACGLASGDIPVQRTLALSGEELRIRAERFVDSARQRTTDIAIKLELIEGSSAVGGGAAPTSELPTTLIALWRSDKSPNEIEAQLRNSSPPIITRIENDRVVIDLRTVTESEEADLRRGLLSLFTSQSNDNSEGK